MHPFVHLSSLSLCVCRARADHTIDNRAARAGLWERSRSLRPGGHSFRQARAHLLLIQPLQGSTHSLRSPCARPAALTISDNAGRVSRPSVQENGSLMMSMALFSGLFANRLFTCSSTRPLCLSRLEKLV